MNYMKWIMGEWTLMNIREVAWLLNVSLSTLRRWDKSWKLKSVRVWKGHRRYRASDIKNLCASRDKKAIFTFSDLFSWIGGFHIAMSEVWWKCISAIEIDSKARITYKHNFYDDNQALFDDGFFFNDITTINGAELPDHDILCAGFPCQSYSIAWYRKGLEDDRGNVFFDMLRIIERKQPRVIFLENVKNLVSHDKWKTLQRMINKLENLWYHIKFKVLNSSEFWNIPQNRERIYIVWFKDVNAHTMFDFPWKIALDQHITDILEKNVDSEFYYYWKPLYKKIKDFVIKSNTAYQWRRQYVRENKKGLIPTLTANMGTGWHNVPIILDTQWIRKLTPTECFNAQGFPNSYKLPSISNWQLYKQIGNSVSVPVLKRIAVEIVRALEAN